MTVHVTIATTGPYEGITGEQGRRVRCCIVAAVPRVG